MLRLVKFLRKIYEKRLEREVRKGNLPEHVMIVTDQNEFENNYTNFLKLVGWCDRFRIAELTICLRLYNRNGVERLVSRIKSWLNAHPLKIVTKSSTLEMNGSKSLKLNFILGYGGRAEITDAIREIAEAVKDGEVSPEEVDEDEIERHLRIKNSPDLIIRAGEEIPDFLIWQSIYSELYFLDTNSGLRYIDFLRCMREYQRRERRFGR
jgi:undecaprenyl diphosphate synthase